MKDLSHLKNRPIQSRSFTGLTRATKEPEAYVAFEPKDSVARVQIRPANGPTWSPYYMHLAAPAFDFPYYTNFVLPFGIITVRARGQNLLPLIKALEMGNAEFIQEFDPDRWAKPEGTEPIIEWMEIEQHGPSSTPQKAAHQGSGSKTH